MLFRSSSAYLRLLIFLPAILILACASSSPAFLMMCTAYKLNKRSEERRVGKEWKPCQTLFLGAPKSADGDCSHEIKRHFLLRRKVMTNLDSILKSRDITFSTKVHPVKAMIFPVVMYGCESWTKKKAEH